MNENPNQYSPDALSWQDRGSCVGMDINLFYHSDDISRDERRYQEQYAKAICNECPVRMQCLQDAVQRNDSHSIQGGTTPKERGITGCAGKSWSIDKILKQLKETEKVNA